MFRILRFLLTGDCHLHEWETMSVDTVSFDNGVSCEGVSLCCKHCGNWKKVNLKWVIMMNIIRRSGKKRSS